MSERVSLSDGINDLAEAKGGQWAIWTLLNAVAQICVQTIPNDTDEGKKRFLELSIPLSRAMGAFMAATFPEDEVIPKSVELIEDTKELMRFFQVSAATEEKQEVSANELPAPGMLQ